MQPLSATDALTPAFRRTHEILFKPFRIGRSWKLAASSYLAYCGSMFVPFPLFLIFIPRAAFAGKPVLLHILLASAAIFFLLYLGLFYCCVRMEFVEFEMVVTRARMVAPMWRRYGAQSLPWFAVKIGIGTIVCAAAAPAVVSICRSFALAIPTAAGQSTPGSSPDALLVPSMLHALFTFYSLFFGIIFLLKLAGTLLNDFVLPFYALEALPLSTAIQRGATVIRRDPLHVLGYLLLKPLLAFTGFLLLEVAILLCLIPFAIIAFLVAFVGAALAHTLGGPASHLLLIIGGALLYVVLYLCLLAVVIGLVGYLMNLLESYGIYFLAGRYPLLASILTPDATQPFTPPPVFPSPEEDSDDTDPPFPMDPALA